MIHNIENGMEMSFLRKKRRKDILRLHRIRNHSADAAMSSYDGS